MKTAIKIALFITFPIWCIPFTIFGILYHEWGDFSKEFDMNFKDK